MKVLSRSTRGGAAGVCSAKVDAPVLNTLVTSVLSFMAFCLSSPARVSFFCGPFDLFTSKCCCFFLRLDLLCFSR